MTALAGFWCREGRPDVDDRVSRMLSAQAIYGPDSKAQWDGGRISIGRQLFRTLPEDRHDTGPAVGAGGSVALVADIRLDNRDDMIRALGLAHKRASAMCDAALLLHGYGRWEEAVIERLYGDFAFAIWDEGRHKLVLARDFLGQRPLHYHRAAGFFAFASMPKGLHALDEVPYGPDEERAAEFLTLMPESGSRSFFAGVERIEAGHIAVVTASGFSTRRYWQPSRSRLVLGSADAYAEGLRHHVDEAVRVRLRGVDGNVGTHLSAGLDSSTVTATAARIMGRQAGHVTAFTSVPRRGFGGAVPSGRIGDEGPLAAATAAQYPNIEHVCVHAAGRSPLATLDRDFFLFERPILNLTNNDWWNAINDEARSRKLRVMLTGQMGNMSISYNGMELLPELLLAGRWIALLKNARGLVRAGGLQWRGIASATMGPFVPYALWNWLRRVLNRGPDIRRYSAIHPDQLTALNLVQRGRARDLDFAYRPRRNAIEARLWVLRRIDMGNYNKGVVGGWGIDQRDPTADRRLIEFCLSLPTEQFVDRGTTRALALRAFSDRLPSTVLSEKRKGFQAADWSEGLDAARNQLAAEIDRLALCAPAATALDLPRLRALTDAWPDEGWENKHIIESYRLALLRGVSTGHFLRKATGSNQ